MLSSRRGGTSKERKEGNGASTSSRKRRRGGGIHFSPKKKEERGGKQTSRPSPARKGGEPSTKRRIQGTKGEGKQILQAVISLKKEKEEILTERRGTKNGEGGSSTFEKSENSPSQKKG